MHLTSISSYIYLAKNLLQKLTGSYLRYPKFFLKKKKVSEDFERNKSSSSICPSYYTVKMYYEL